MLRTFNIYIARSNLVSPSNSDTHHMGQVQVRMKIYVLSGFVSSIVHLPLLSSFFRGMNAIHVFLSFSGGCIAVLQPLSRGLWNDGRVHEQPKKMNQSKLPWRH